MEIVDGELIVTYTDGTSQNLGNTSSGGSQTPTPYEYLKFESFSTSNGYEVAVSMKDDYKSIIEEAVIPETYNGRPVTRIAENGFSNCYVLKSVSIPNSVTCIDENAFSTSLGLKSLTIPSSVTKLCSTTSWDTRIETLYFEVSEGWTLNTNTSVSSAILSDPSRAADYWKKMGSGNYMQRK